jgi:hypothetical protein
MCLRAISQGTGIAQPSSGLLVRSPLDGAASFLLLAVAALVDQGQRYNFVIAVQPLA